jgi:hypothetical protein
LNLGVQLVELSPGLSVRWNRRGPARRGLVVPVDHHSSPLRAMGDEVLHRHAVDDRIEFAGVGDGFEQRLQLRSSGGRVGEEFILGRKS